MCEIELEPCDVWSEAWRTARKEHRCSSCRREIVPGERYMTHFSKYDGAVLSERLCGLCVADRQEFADAHYASLCQPSYFPEMLEGCIDEGDEDSMTRWKPMLAAIRRRRRASVAESDEAQSGGATHG